MTLKYFRKHQRRWILFCFLIILSNGPLIHAGESIEVFRADDELIIQIDRLDLLRQKHSRLSAVVKLRGEGKDRELLVDLTDAAVHGALVIDLSKFDKCKGVSVAVTDGAGKLVAEKAVAPVPEVPVKSIFPASSAGPFADIEPGRAMITARAASGASFPKIQLPEVQQLRPVKIDLPKQSISKQDITFPVIATEGDSPLCGETLVGRQTAAPDDTTKASLYFAYKKAIFDGDKAARFRKFLVEVPISNSWGKGQGDETVIVGNEFEVHVTNETMAPDASGMARNILGEGEASLGQLFGFNDERGRMYWTASTEGSWGAYLVRFDPHTKKFEQIPGNLRDNNLMDCFQNLIPKNEGKLNDMGKLGLSEGKGMRAALAAHNRIFFIIPGGDPAPGDPLDVRNRRLGGIFSISQDWSNASAFAADIRLHVGNWKSATPTVYEVNSGARKMGKVVLTEAGLFIEKDSVSPAGAKSAIGGPWRLDLDEKGNNKAFGEVEALTSTRSKDGRTSFSPTQVVVRYLRDVGMGGGRHLVKPDDAGGIIIPRASIRQLLLSDGWDDSMRDPGDMTGRMPTYTGAPRGAIMMKVPHVADLVEKIKTVPEAQGEFAASFSGGRSLGPEFLITPMPGQADKALAVCEYGYTLSSFDFSSIQDKKTVFKTDFPTRGGLSLGLGPYNSLWVQQDDELWFHVVGYTGMTRIKYSKGGKLVVPMSSVRYHARIAAQPMDQHGRENQKWTEGFIHVFGGRLMDAGYSQLSRGGNPFTAGIQLFDPKLLTADPTNKIPSQTAAYMCRTVSKLVGSPQSRVIWSAHDGSRRQEIFTSGTPFKGYVDALDALAAAPPKIDKAGQPVINPYLDSTGKSIAPTNLNNKVFLYEVSEKDGLRDLFGFTMPRSEKGEVSQSYLAMSPCHRFLVIYSGDGLLYTYHISQKQFVDGGLLQSPDGNVVQGINFKRPSEYLLTAPNGELFFLSAPFIKGGASVQFNRIVVDHAGRLSIEPHLGIDGANSSDWQDLEGVIRCFLPDLKNKDGSFDLILGYKQKDMRPSVRVITDFIPPTPNDVKSKPSTLIGN